MKEPVQDGNSGNVGIGTTQFVGGSKVLSLGLASTVPGAFADAAIFYVRDVTDSDTDVTAEMMVKDEDGFETNLSSHLPVLFSPDNSDPLPSPLLITPAITLSARLSMQT